MRRFFFLTALFTAALVASGGAWDAQRQQQKRVAALAQEAAVERALAAPIPLREFSGREMPLEAFLQEIAGRIEVPLRVRWSKLEEVDAFRDTRIVPFGQNLPLEAELNLALDDSDLMAIPHDGALLITSRDDAFQLPLTTRVYPLPVVLGPGFRGSDVSYDWWELVTTHCTPDSWDDVGGPGTAQDAPGALVIANRNDVHREIKNLLNQFSRLTNEPGPGTAPWWHASATPPEQKIRQALTRKISLDIRDMPLEEALDLVSQRIGVRVHIRRRKLEEADVSLQIPVSLVLRDVSVESLLRHLLQPLELAHLVRDDVLQITTRDNSLETLPIVIYNVRDLVETGAGPAAFDYDSLIDLITTTAQPDSWDDVGGPGSIASLDQGWLVISQTDEFHAEVAELLAKLREHLALGRGGSLPSLPSKSVAEKKIRQALDRPIRLEFEEVPLGMVADELSRQFGINVLVDWPHLKEIGFPEPIPLTCRLPELPLRDALSLALRLLDPYGYELGWTLQDEALVFTTSDRALAQRELLVRDCRPLLTGGASRELLDQEALTDLVTTLVERDLWDDTGGPATTCAFRGLVVTSGPLKLNARVARFLDHLEQELAGRHLPKVAGAASEPTAQWLDRSAGDLAILEKLRQPVRVDPRGKSLTVTLTQLAQDAGVPILFDHPLLVQEDINPSRFFIDLPLADISLSAALEHLLDQADDRLRWCVENGAILISCDTYAPYRRFARLYRVDDLIGQEGAKATEELAKTLERQLWYSRRDEDIGIGELSTEIPGVLLLSDTLAAHFAAETFLTRLRRTPVGDSSPPPTREIMAQEAIEAALDREIDFQGNEATFGRFMDGLRKKLDVNIVFTRRARGAMVRNPKMDWNFSGVPARQGLLDELADQSLGFAIRDEAICITWRYKYEPSLWYFDVSHLLKPVGNYQRDELEEYLLTASGMDGINSTPEVDDLILLENLVVARCDTQTQQRLQQALMFLRLTPRPQPEERTEEPQPRRGAVR